MSWTKPNRVALVAFLTALSLFVLGSTAFAHASLVNAEPPIGAALEQAPEIVRLFFSEEIEPQFSAFGLYDAQGVKIEDVNFQTEAQGRQVALRLKRLESGTYSLTWKVLSAVDGHVTKAIYPFSVGMSAASSPPVASETSGQLSTARLATRWLVLLSALALAGMFFFSLMLNGLTLPETLSERSRTSCWVSLSVFAAAGVGDMLLYARDVSAGDISQTFAVLWQTRYGIHWLIRLALVFGIALLFTRQRRTWPAAALGALLLLSISLSSHSAALPDGAYLAIFADWVHLLFAAIWVGGLLQLSWLVLSAGFRRIEAGERGRLLAALTPRFYNWALVSAVALLLTGFHLMYRHMPNLETALWTTPYGQAFMAKHLVLLLLVALAAADLLWRRTSPQLVRMQALVAVAIVLLAGLLTSVPTARQTVGSTTAAQRHHPLLFAQQAEGLTVALTVAADKVGENDFNVLLADAAGKPVTAALRVMLSFTFLDRDLGTLTARAEDRGAGRYAARGSFISLLGKWQIEVAARFADRADDVRAVFTMDLGESKAGAQAELDLIAAGKALYAEKCAACHGEAGRGDGPLAVSLPLRPADLTTHLAHHTDQSLGNVIRQGLKPAMPGFDFTDAQMRQLIQYLRQLSHNP